MKTAIVHEWFVNYAGSERVVESFVNIFPEADVFALVDFLNDEQREKILKGKRAKTTFIQNMPFANKRHRNYLPLFPKAIESLDLSKYDLILSSSHSVSKGIKKRDDQLHITYCHSPMRYIWDQTDHYLTGLKKGIAKPVVSYLRKWDLNSAKKVDFFIANSNHIAGKIKKIYDRNADVIYPPVDVDEFALKSNKKNFYVTASRLVPYKRIDLIVEAFSEIPDKKLFVIGNGPEKDMIKQKAGSNIEMIGYLEQENLKDYLQNAKAFLFAAEEDFGIIIVEAMACGTPVIAFDKGGASESVINNKTGILFPNQDKASLIKAVEEFEKISGKFDLDEIRIHAEKFSRNNFENKISNYVEEKTKEFFRK